MAATDTLSIIPAIAGGAPAKTPPALVQNGHTTLSGEEIQDLRSLLRARKQLTREQTCHVQRLQKTLEEANIKLD